MEFDLNMASPLASPIDFGTSNSSIVEDGVFVTKELFPHSKGMVLGANSSSSSSSLLVDHGLRSCDFGGNQQQQQQVKRSRRGPRSRSSQYRGVTFYRRTRRWESHIWDCGKQVYLGGLTLLMLLQGLMIGLR